MTAISDSLLRITVTHREFSDGEDLIGSASEYYSRNGV